MVLLAALSGCAQGGVFKSNPDAQRYLDLTETFFPGLQEKPIQHAWFAFVNRDRFPDMLVAELDADGTPSVRVWLNRKAERFAKLERPGWVGTPGDTILAMRARDLNHDRAADLVLIGRFQDGDTVKVLINNGRGYFYTPQGYRLPPFKPGLDRVDMVDVDQDGNIDLFFTGHHVLNQGDPDTHQVQFLLNNGKGEFRDVTQLLMPLLPAGIRGTSFADYDGDKVIDIFLVYDTGRNRILINNGLGQFTDRTRDLLPFVRSQSLFADWADFDMDGDNDLLVVNEAIDPRSRTYENEYSYVLVNNGSGYFRKGPLRAFPAYPSRAVYLLDANADQIPDIIILSRQGIHYQRGLGKWRFLKESSKRLPANRHFEELTFTDVNNDGHLDFFGIVRGEGRGHLWVNSFK
ncbi:FG-GAP repeat domain-containing protein [Nitrospina watsonii]|uniref:FG-GAP repeat domain-containing protein n=1 Tax=Nitrospina watsonii TaxID=1323948 RepID=UPI0024904008|nr:VCBS repeat-containing protein [Nitrospina watsonii]